ncbi:ferric reductase-like transmembrane domain-containing protein [Clostridium sp. Ade.TY]|uniref:ferric reductase-like transmembrane domain-containing protein n=1 Tax=Clostridium sp. Ade.TY TaxID=1391647 RepID=UPI000404690B|nr:ferric reductase-like transmembrane domain-containing protein [Clostridium sp. Ade.TY]
MYLIYSLIIVLALSLILPKAIRNYSKLFYGLATIISILVTIYEILRLTNGYKLEGFIGALEKAFMKGNVAIAFFVLVMFAGALNKKYGVTKKLLSIRAELAILGSILIMPHCIMYLVRFINKLMAGKPITILYVIYLIIGLIAFFIMIPLFITSFKKIRSKMEFKKWKKVQRFAYPFYFLIYVHIMIALFNHKLDWIKIITYTVLFVGYFILKVFNENKN